MNNKIITNKLVEALKDRIAVCECFGPESEDCGLCERDKKLLEKITHDKK